MKACITLLSFLFALTIAVTGQEAISPAVAREFGEPVVVRAELVSKGNTYYDQNMVAEAYTLKVVAVDDHELKEPVLIEYVLEADKKQKKAIERPGTVQTFEAYESLYQPINANPWLGPGEQGMRFVLVHVLHVRPLPKKG